MVSKSGVGGVVEGCWSGFGRCWAGAGVGRIL